MKPSLYARYALWESRGSGGRAAFFLACLAVGVAAVVAVAALAASLEAGIRAEARKLLAADLKVEGRRPLPPELDAELAALAGEMPGLERVDVKELVTIVAAPGTGGGGEGSGGPGRSQLVELKAVGAAYPFYGELLLAPDRPLAELLTAETAVVAPDLLARLGLAVGDALRVGGEEFRIAGTVVSEPDRLAITLTLGPRVFLSLEGLERTGLLAFGSRVSHRALLRLPDGIPAAAVAGVAERLEAALPATGNYNLETWREAQPALRQGLHRMKRFLGLVALLSLLAGGIGVAQAVRAWLAGRMDAIAVLRCLGARPREVAALYLGQTAALGLAGSLLGALAGLALQYAAPALLGDLVPAGAIRFWQPLAAARGLALGTAVAVLFSIPPLAAARRVSPARVLRREAEPLPGSPWARAATAGALLGGIFAMAAWQSGSALLGLQFTAGVVAAVAALAGAAWGISALARRVPRGFAGFAVRHGLAALGRPGAATLGAVVALGLGVLVVLAMALVERHLADQLDADLPAEAPSAFLVDIQPDQWSGVRRLLAEARAADVDSVPVVSARLAAIDGARVEELAERSPEDRSRRWALTREQRLTYLEELPPDNELVAGALWRDPERAEVSLEEEFATDLGVGLGSVLTFDIQGVPLTLTVTSLREVDWGTFRINFFLVVEPGVLEEAPQSRIAAARLPPGAEQPFQDRLAAAFPNVTLLPIRDILEKIVAVLERLGLGVRFLGGFAVLAGIAILGGAVSATTARRGREVALLKTLGLTRGGVMATFAVEYALVGLAAGGIGTAGGGVLAWAVLTRGMEIPWSFHPLPFALALAGGALLTVAAGLAASLRALARRPVEVLRGE